MDLKGADIEGGYDLVAEYGASLSIDPTARREEIITLMPIFEKAGIDTRTILSLLKLNDLDGAYDRVTMAADRQREIFEEMIKNDLYIKPKELQDHKNMLAFSYDYLMSSEFKYLTPEHQALLERHIKDREALAAQGPQPGVAPAGEVVQTAPAPTPGPGGPTQVPAAPPIQ
jgi:hypothetical protein